MGECWCGLHITPLSTQNVSQFGFHKHLISKDNQKLILQKIFISSLFQQWFFPTVEEYIAIAKEKHGYNVEQVCLLFRIIRQVHRATFTKLFHQCRESTLFFKNIWKTFNRIPNTIEAYSQFKHSYYIFQAPWTGLKFTPVWKLSKFDPQGINKLPRHT